MPSFDRTDGASTFLGGAAPDWPIPSFERDPNLVRVREGDLQLAQQPPADRTGRPAPIDSRDSSNHYLKFDGRYLKLYDGDKVIWEWPTVSGKENFGSPLNQDKRNYGPMPEGTYDIKQERYQTMSGWRKRPRLRGMHRPDRQHGRFRQGISRVGARYQVVCRLFSTRPIASLAVNNERESEPCQGADYFHSRPESSRRRAARLEGAFPGTMADRCSDPLLSLLAWLALLSWLLVNNLRLPCGLSPRDGRQPELHGSPLQLSARSSAFRSSGRPLG